MSHIFYLLVFAGQFAGYPQVPALFLQGYAYATYADCQVAKAVSLATGRIKDQKLEDFESGDFACLTIDLGALSGPPVSAPSPQRDRLHPGQGGSPSRGSHTKTRIVVSQTGTIAPRP